MCSSDLKVSDRLITTVNEILAAHPGNTTVKFSIEDSAENISVEAPSKKMKVKASKALIDSLTTTKVIEVKVN